MRLSNSQRNEFFSYVLACDLSACQLKFVIYLYNNTWECQMDDIWIPSLSALAKVLGYDRAYFQKEIKELINISVIDRTKRKYKINIDYKIWLVDNKRHRMVKGFCKFARGKQLARIKKQGND